VLNNGKVVLHLMVGFEQMLRTNVGLWLKGFLELKKLEFLHEWHGNIYYSGKDPFSYTLLDEFIIR